MFFIKTAPLAELQVEFIIESVMIILGEVLPTTIDFVTVQPLASLSVTE